MDIIFQTFYDFWFLLTDYVPEEILTLLVGVSLVGLLYFLFIRVFLSLFKKSKLIRICDIIFLAIIFVYILSFIFPEIRFVKEVLYNAAA